MAKSPIGEISYIPIAPAYNYDALATCDDGSCQYCDLGLWLYESCRVRIYGEIERLYRFYCNTFPLKVQVFINQYLTNYIKQELMVG